MKKWIAMITLGALIAPAALAASSTGERKWTELNMASAFCEQQSASPKREVAQSRRPVRAKSGAAKAAK